MNTSEIKKFATAARRILLQGVRNKLLTLGFNEQGEVTLAQLPVLAYNDTNFNGRIIPGKRFYYQWTALQRAINEKGISNICEEAAYTWFNRLVAIRILQKQEKNLIRNVLDFVDDSCTPAIVHDARHGIVQGVSETMRGELDRLLLDDTQTTEQFSILISAFCEDTPLLSKIFGRINDYTELLLPNDILNVGGFVDLLNNSAYITDDDYLQTELIGWLYQFYISEKKDEVFAKKGKFAADEIPAATQIFTPNWIVKYMVQNTLGRIYLDKYPEASFKSDLKYLVEPAEGAKYEFDSLEQLRCGDLACGSGHILVELFDLLYRMYEEEWYDSATAIENIFTQNLVGIDLDTRAKQLAMFALLLKACQKDTSFVDAHILPRVLDMPNADDPICEHYPVLKQAQTLGSIMKIEKRADAPSHPLVEALTTDFSVLVMNPPYMGSGNMNPVLSDYVKRNYEEGKADLFSTFMLLAIDRLADCGKYGMINMHSWMFLSSFEKLRKTLLDNYHIDSLLHLGPRTFDELSGEVVQNAAFVVSKVNYASVSSKETNSSQGGNNSFPTWEQNVPKEGIGGEVRPHDAGTYFRLVDGKNCSDKERMFLDAQVSQAEMVCFPNVDQNNFEKIPGCPIGYWVSEKVVSLFENERFAKYFDVKEGLKTADNNRFIRFWFEISIVLFNNKWFPHTKGGEFRRWFGNNYWVLNYANDGYELKHFKGATITSPENFFKPYLTYSRISSGKFNLRFTPEGFIPNMAGLSIVPKGNESPTTAVLAFGNSPIFQYLLDAENPTLNNPPGLIAQMPLLNLKEELNSVVKENIKIAKNDWDAHETSWDFEANPLVALRNQKVAEGCLDSAFRLKDFVEQFENIWLQRFTQLHQNEEELNRQFIEIYGLQDELTPDVPMDEITILQQGEISIVNNEIEWHNDVLMKQLISYAMGCWMGRYRLDKPGLHIAHPNPSAEELAPYEAYGKTFEIDDDGIVPLMDEESPFADNAVSRMKDFVSMVFGADHLAENLNYIRECLGMTLEKYFQTGFWKDHLARYQKRPIYWLFQSNKKNPVFQVLVYMHRMDAYSCEKVRTYLLSYIDYLKQRINQLEQNAGSLSPAETRQMIKMKDSLKECLSYEERLHHVANQQIAFDLDDGVKVNYAKFGDVLAAIS